MSEQVALEKAEQLSTLFSMDKLHPKALAFLRTRPIDEAWAIAVSGGVDSVALLYLLCSFFPKRKRFFHVLHYNHALRGEDSNSDECLVRKHCEELGVSFYSEVWQRDADRSVSESEAREARLGFFERKLSDLAIPVILTAHQKEDIAETLLMRVARGSTADGLAAPRPVHFYEQGFSHYRVRPLLSLEKEELLAACKKVAISWNEDSSNQSFVYTRNRLRNRVIPSLCEAIPQNFIEGASRVREIQEEYAELIEFTAAPVLKDLSFKKGQCLDLSNQSKVLPKAVLRYILSYWLVLNELISQVSSKNFEKLLSSILSREELCVSLSEKLQIISSVGILSLKEEELLLQLCDNKFLPLSLALNSIVYFPNNSALKLELLELDDLLIQKIRSGKVDCSTQAYLRYDEGARISASIWKTGDRYQAIGATGRAKLQDVFINKKIPRKERRNLPIVRIEHDIVWCPNLPPAEAYKIVKGLKRALKLTYIA